jgi:hypothetical protein
MVNVFSFSCYLLMFASLCLFISVVSMESIMVFWFTSCVIRVLNSSMRDLRERSALLLSCQHMILHWRRCAVAAGVVVAVGWVGMGCLFDHVGRCGLVSYVGFCEGCNHLEYCNNVGILCNLPGGSRRRVHI